MTDKEIRKILNREYYQKTRINRLEKQKEYYRLNREERIKYQIEYNKRQ